MSTTTDPMARPPDSAPPLFASQSTSRQAELISALMSRRRYAQILRHLQDHGPATIFEVANALGVFDHQISGRFGELERQGAIRKTGRRKPKPATGCQAEIYELDPTEPPVSPSRQLARGHYPETFIVAGEGPFDLSPPLGETDLPGVPYQRRGAGETWRFDLVECPGCGRPLTLYIEQAAGQPRKRFRCNAEGCHRTWELTTVHAPGRHPQLALVAKVL